MKLLLLPLLIISVNIYAASSFSSTIDSNYNSVSASLGVAQGDFEGNIFGLSGNVELSKGLLLQYDYASTEFEELSRNNVEHLDLKDTRNSYGFGYIFRNAGYHFIPYVSFGSSELSILTTDFGDVDLTRFGAVIRVPMSDDSIFSFSIENLSYDDEFSTNQGDQFNEELNNVLRDVTTVSGGLEIHYNDNLSVIYGVSSVDMDVFTMSVNAVFNF